MNNLITTNIENLIYEVRGKQVMLDSDLAKLYQCKNGTKDINKAVKRNIEKFPEDFYFQLTLNECSRFQIGTLNKSNNRGSNIKYLPHVFTEQGVAMLSSVLHTELANKTSVAIMRAFVEMHKYISNNLIEQKYINNLVLEDHENIKLLQESFNKLEEKTKINHIFFEGQIYDSYSFLIDLFNKANNEIIIIDNYAGKELLDIIKEINKKIIIVSSNIDDKLKEKYVKQYSNVEFKDNKTFHDRFIIIDRKYLYHSGGSFKDLGRKCIGINKIDDINYLNEIIKII